MICTRCANVIGLVGADKRTLLALVNICQVPRRSCETRFFRLRVVISVL